MNSTEKLAFRTEEGTQILVEVDPDDYGEQQVSRGGIAQAKQTFEEALSHLATIADKVKSQIETSRCDSASVEFGVKLSGETGVVLAKASTEAHLKITLKWDGLRGD